ncbi:MAG: DNA adenine methylase [Lentisphaeria bacterium]|nr:DNA adenine methylase [Lentisphaeria bacterium]
MDQAQPNPEFPTVDATSGEDPRFLNEQILTYIGNKRALLGFIGQAVERVKSRVGKSHIATADVFAGSGIVSRFLKQHSTLVQSCDLERYCAVVSQCYMANRGEIDEDQIAEAVAHVNRESVGCLAPGFLAENYAPANDAAIQPGERVFYTRRNACFLDTARHLIDELAEDLRPFVLAPLLYEASVHANTSGVFKGFYKNSETGLGQFGGNRRNALSRILTDIEIPMPVFSKFHCQTRHHCGDANDFVRTAQEVDLAYMDPPYNQHPYGSNYFMLNLLATHQAPSTVSAVSGIPVDWNRSAYNRRGEIGAAFAGLVEDVRASHVLVSFNSEGFIPHEEMLDLLARFGVVESLEMRYNTFRGSRNLHGRSIHVKEYLYLLEKS